MKRSLISAALVVALVFGQPTLPSRSSTALAKSGTPSSITMILIGLNCATPLGGGTFLASGYSFGASLAVDPAAGGIGAGKANVGDLNVVRSMDACSPALFSAVVSGKHIQTATLVQTDANGNTLLTVTLTDALVSSYQISGNQQSASPAESISFAFSKICIEEASSGAKVCYDASQVKTT